MDLYLYLSIYLSQYLYITIIITIIVNHKYISNHNKTVLISEGLEKEQNILHFENNVIFL